MYKVFLVDDYGASVLFVGQGERLFFVGLLQKYCFFIVFVTFRWGEKSF